MRRAERVANVTYFDETTQNIQRQRRAWRAGKYVIWMKLQGNTNQIQRNTKKAVRGARRGFEHSDDNTKKIQRT